MNQTTPAERDRAQRRIRALTTATAAAAGILALLGAAVAAGTFAGRTVAAAAPDQSTQTAPTDPAIGLQPPAVAPGDGSGVVPGTVPITSGGS